MTSSGLYFSGYVPESFILLIKSTIGLERSSDFIVSLLAASVVQLGIFFSYIAFAGSRRFVSLATLIFFPLFIVLVIFSAFMSTFSIVLNSRGDSLRTGFQNRISTAYTDVISLDESMVAIFQGQVGAFNKLAEDSRLGFDESGIARCGERCRSNLNKARGLQEKYGPILGRTLQSQENIRELDVSQLFILTRSLKAQANQKFATYINFCAEYSIPCSIDVAKQKSIAIDVQLDAISQSIFDAPPDRNILVLNEVASLFFFPKIWLDTRLNILVPIVISLVPDLVSVILTAFMRLQISGAWITSGNALRRGELDLIRDEIDLLSQKSKLQAELRDRKIREELDSETLKSFD